MVSEANGGGESGAMRAGGGPKTRAGSAVRSDSLPCTVRQAVLGEGLRWDDRRGELLGVDILAGSVFRGRVDEDGGLTLLREYWVPATVGAVAPVEADEGWILAAGRGFVHLSPDGALRPIVEVAPLGTRMNDGACDPQGRLWAGTLADDFRPGAGALYRLDHAGRSELMLDDLTISNGLGWSPDGSTLYLADTPTRGTSPTVGSSSRWPTTSVHPTV